MLALITSPAALFLNGSLSSDMVKALKDVCALGHKVGVTSNHTKPAWFDQTFNGSDVKFLKTDARQNGEIIRNAADSLKISPHDILVLAIKPEDMQMAKNGQAMLIAAGWSPDRAIRGLGIKIASPAELIELVKLTDGWSGHWWFEGDTAHYKARALADLSGFGNSITASQKAFASKLTSTVKSGGPKLTALSLLASRSLLKDGIYDAESLLWGVYPSSKAVIGDAEVLSDFTHSLRTTVSLARFAKREEPLFIRHTPSEKRSLNRGADRTDPVDQVTTLHLNPFYKTRLRNRNVVVVDDCTTWGLSFGVAAAFLKAGGAASVTGLALGKFGNTMKSYDILIKSDPFSPVQAHQFTHEQCQHFGGATDPRAQQALIRLMP